jgi:hypothetical protein
VGTAADTNTTGRKAAPRRAEPWLKRWLLHGGPEEPEGLYEDRESLERHPRHRQHP